MYRYPECSEIRPSTDAKVRDLLKRMTIEEKVAQLGSVPAWELIKDGKLVQEKVERFLSRGIGQITRVAGSSDVDPIEAAIIGSRFAPALSRVSLLLFYRSFSRQNISFEDFFPLFLVCYFE